MHFVVLHAHFAAVEIAGLVELDVVGGQLTPALQPPGQANETGGLEIAEDLRAHFAVENGLGVRVVLEQERQVKELRCRRERGEVCHGGQHHVQRALLHGLDHGAVIAERRVRVDLDLDLAAGSFGDELSKVVSAFVRRGAVSNHMAERERVARAGVIAVAGRLVVVGLAAAACAEAQCHDKDQYQCSESFFHT